MGRQAEARLKEIRETIEGNRKLESERKRLQTGVVQTLKRRRATPGDEYVADTEQRQRHVRQWRQIAGCTDRALDRNYRQHIGV